MSPHSKLETRNLKLETCNHVQSTERSQSVSAENWKLEIGNSVLSVVEGSKLSPGFTLVEMLVVLVISIISMFFLLGSLLNGIQSRQRAVAVSDMQKTMNYILDDITGSVRWADRIDTHPPPPGNVWLETFDSSNVLIAGYQLNGDDLERSDPTPSTFNLNPQDVIVTQFQLTPLPDEVNPNRVVVDLAVAHQQLTQLPPLTTSLTVSIRINQIGTP